MHFEDARRNLEDEQERLEKLRHGFDDEQLHDQSEDESLGELSHFSQHVGDVGSETFEREKDFSILEQIEAELGDVERALQRLDEGTYGTCEACHQPIDDARLEAQPATRFCIVHQGEAEAELAT